MLLVLYIVNQLERKIDRYVLCFSLTPTPPNPLKATVWQFIVFVAPAMPTANASIVTRRLRVSHDRRHFLVTVEVEKKGRT